MLGVVGGANEFLDRLPRVRFGRGSREAPAFRTCGVAGFYVAVVVAFAGGLLAGRSLLVVAALCAVCGLSFFVYALGRKLLTGREELVLLEHVWFAEACAAGTLVALGEPVLAYLDVVSVALAFFLAGGRVGCLLVGCCHGRPSSFGISYGDECAAEGFPRHLVRVRLFPVQAVEAAGLALVGLTGLLALPFARPGAVFAWFLLAYAVMRFGLEGIRGDERPELFGLSQSRWMCLVELATALVLGFREGRGGLDGPRTAAVLAFLGATLVGGLAFRRARDPARALLGRAHLEELRSVVAEDAPPSVLRLRTTSRGVSLAVSRSERALHLSISLRPGLRDLPLLCELAARAVGGARPAEAALGDEGVLHLLVPPGPATGADELARELYGDVVRRLQSARSAAVDGRERYFGAGDA